MKKKQYILKAATDNNYIYGILSVNTDVDAMALQSAMYEARTKAMNSNKWSVEDAIDLLPENLEANLDTFATMYI